MVEGEYGEGTEIFSSLLALRKSYLLLFVFQKSNCFYLFLRI